MTASVRPSVRLKFNLAWMSRGKAVEAGGLSIQYLRDTGPGYFSFLSWKWTISIPPIPDVGWRPPTDREKWKGTPFKLLNRRWEPVQKLLINWNALERDQGRHYSFSLFFFPFLASYPDCFRSNELARVISYHYLSSRYLERKIVR